MVNTFDHVYYVILHPDGRFVVMVDRVPEGYRVLPKDTFHDYDTALREMDRRNREITRAGK